MNDLVLTIDNYKDYLDQIILGKKLQMDNSTKYPVYMETDIPDNLIIKTPPIRLIFSYTNQIYNNINLPLYPNYSKMKSFIKMIKEIEEKMQTINKDEMEWVSNIKKTKKLKSLKLNFPKNNELIKIISNDPLVKNINNLQSGGMVQLIIYGSHLWKKNEGKRSGLNLEICQIKYEGIQNILEKNFFTPNKKVIRPPPLPKQETPRTEKKAFVPSQDMLLDQLSKLKKSN